MDLTEREIYVLRKRFGIREPALTLNEVGQWLKVGSERIRQIQEKALRKLLHPSRKHHPMIEEIINAPTPNIQNKHLSETIERFKERRNHAKR